MSQLIQTVELEPTTPLPKLNKMLLKRLNNEIKFLKNDLMLNFSVGPINPIDITLWQATIIGPEDTPYHNGVFNLIIKFTDTYPFKPPHVYFTTPIYHCNISKNGEICLDILKDNWSPALDISKLLLSISSLLSDPNPTDPLVPEIAILLKSNKIIHDLNAREYTIKHAN